MLAQIGGWALPAARYREGACPRGQEPSGQYPVASRGSGSSRPSYPMAADCGRSIVAVAETNGPSVRRMALATRGLCPCQDLRAG
jgi:hypothetical protein